jgi:alpha-beta hydrolase superfamily lysophospholipase
MFAIPATPDAPMLDSQPPRLPLLLREMASFAVTRARASFASAVTVPKTGNGSDIVVLPGFMASDVTTARLRRSLIAAGHNAHGWGLGRNYGIQKDVFERVDARLDALGLDGPVTLVGWSLGGIIAREYAKYAPHRVNRVVTLGTPFSGDPRANNAWRLYEMVAGYKVDAPPIDAVLEEKPPMQTLAFWSRRDGVVAPRSARGKTGQSDKHIELRCTHMAFVADPAAIRAICQAIAS